MASNAVQTKALIGHDGRVDLGDFRQAFVEQCFSGDPSPEMIQILKLDTARVALPIVPFVLIDLGSDDPLSQVDRLKRFPPRQLPSVGHVFEPHALHPPMSDARYQHFLKTYGETLESWLHHGTLVLKKTAQKQFDMSLPGNELLPYIKQLPHIRESQTALREIVDGMRTYCVVQKRAINNLLSGHSWDDLPAEKKQQVTKHHAALRDVHDHPMVMNLTVCMHVINDLDLHYEHNIPFVDHVMHARRVYLQQACFARGLCLSRGYRRQQEDIKNLQDSGNDEALAILQKASEAALVDPITQEIIPLMTYFEGFSDLGKVLAGYHHRLWINPEEKQQHAIVQEYMMELAQKPMCIFQAINVFKKEYARKAIVYQTVDPTEMMPHTCAGVRVPVEQVSKAFKLNFKYDLPAWFAKASVVGLGPHQEFRIKFYLDMEQATTPEVTSYYQALIAYHMDSFTHYVKRLGWGMSHDVAF